MTEPLQLDMQAILERLPHRYPVPAGRPGAGMPSRQEHPRAEERHLQRAVLSRALPAPSGDAGRHDHRGAGADGRHPGFRHRQRHSRSTTRASTSSASTRRASASPVEPGDQLMLTAQVERALKGIWKFATTAHVGEHEVAHAEMMVAPESGQVIDRARRRRPRGAAGRRRHGRSLQRHRARTWSDRPGHGRRPARRHQRSDHHRRRQPDLPVRLHRRCAAGQEVQRRADAPRDRRSQRVSRELHRQPRHHPRPGRHPHRQRQPVHGLLARGARLPGRRQDRVRQLRLARRPRRDRRLGDPRRPDRGAPVLQDRRARLPRRRHDPSRATCRPTSWSPATRRCRTASTPKG